MSTRRVVAYASSLTLHLLAGAGIFWLASAARPRPVQTGQADATMAVFVVLPARESTLPGLNPIDTSQGDSVVRRGAGLPALSLPDFTFDFGKIADRATLLFPFLTPGLSLERFALMPRREVNDSLHNPFAPAPTERPQPGERKPPLELGDRALQSLIDTCWSRRDRWGAFQPIIKLLNTYNPNVGKLPAVLRTYLEQNGLQPYSDPKIRDPRLWIELSLAADHVNFIGFVSRYASEHPSTKATTELLFLLDKLAQASLDALVTLLDIDPKEDLRWTRDANSDAYGLITDLRRHYRAELERKGLSSPDALARYYDGVRLTILTRILRTTPHGYRASDARFLIGTIYWAERRAAEALQSWRDMTIDPTDGSVTAYSDILTAIRDSTGPNSQSLDAKQINRILNAEHGRWISLSIDRLRQFGYHFDTF